MSNEHGTQGQRPAPDGAAAIARAFTDARRAGKALPAFPGEIPGDLVAAYHVQDRAIGLWSDTVVGWKVGYIAAERRDGSGDERLLGPIFKRQLWNDTGGTSDIPVFVGGFGAVEAEYVLELLEDAPAGQLHWSRNRPKRCLRASTSAWKWPAVRSPPSTNSVRAWWWPTLATTMAWCWARDRRLTARDENSLRAETLIEGEVVGTGGATRLPGGLRAAYAFALSRSALRGRPLRKGDLIATGNATGIHDIEAGQTALVRFAGFGDIACRAVPAG